LHQCRYINKSLWTGYSSWSDMLLWAT